MDPVDNFQTTDSIMNKPTTNNVTVPFSVTENHGSFFVAYDQRTRLFAAFKMVEPDLLVLRKTRAYDSVVALRQCFEVFVFDPEGSLLT